MKSVLAKLRVQYWDTRAPSERRFIVIGACFVLPILCYLLLWQPSHDAVSKLYKQMPQLRIGLAQMRQSAAQVEEMRHRPKVAVMDAMAVKSAIEESASRHQLLEALTSVTPQEPNGARITLTAVAFEKWLVWLRELQTAQHLRIDTVAITRLSEPGMVSVRASLTNAP